MKPIDLLLLTALVSLCVAVALWSLPVALVVFSAGSVGLWFLLDEADA